MNRSFLMGAAVFAAGVLFGMSMQKNALNSLLSSLDDEDKK